MTRSSTSSSARTYLRFRVGDDAAVVERQDAAGVPGHHSMSCSTNSTVDAFRPHRVHDHVHDPELLLGAYPARRFVEQQDLRLHDHRQRDVEQLAHPAGQDLRRLVAVLGQSEPPQSSRAAASVAVRLVSRNRLVAARKRAASPRCAGRCPSPIIRFSSRTGCRRVAESGTSGRCPVARDLARKQGVMSRSRKWIATGGRLDVPRDHVDEGGLPGAVGADQPDHDVLFELPADVIAAVTAPKCLVRLSSSRITPMFKPSFARANSDHSPSGRKTMTISSAMPRGPSARCWAKYS